MFMMPKKQKRAFLSQVDEDVYTLAFTNLELDDNEFNRIIHEDVLVCLNDIGGRLIDSSLETKTIKLKTRDIKSLRLNLIRRSYFIQTKNMGR